MKIIISKQGLIAGIPVNLGINYLYPIGFGLPDYFLQDCTGVGLQNF